MDSCEDSNSKGALNNSKSKRARVENGDESNQSLGDDDVAEDEEDDEEDDDEDVGPEGDEGDYDEEGDDPEGAEDEEDDEDDA